MRSARDCQRDVPATGVSMRPPPSGTHVAEVEAREEALALGVVRLPQRIGRTCKLHGQEQPVGGSPRRARPRSHFRGGVIKASLEGARRRLRDQMTAFYFQLRAREVVMMASCWRSEADYYS